jgi:hypothetical protein
MSVKIDIVRASGTALCHFYHFRRAFCWFHQSEKKEEKIDGIESGDQKI